MGCFSVCLQATSTLLQAMEYSVHRLVLAVVANRACRHKNANDNCRHFCESQMIPTPKGLQLSHNTMANFLWLQRPNKEMSIQDGWSLKIQPATGFQPNFKIIKRLHVVENGNLNEKRAELSPRHMPIYSNISITILSAAGIKYVCLRLCRSKYSEHLL